MAAEAWVALFAAAMSGAPVHAIAPRASLPGLYVRARAAEDAGDAAAARADFSALIAADPANQLVARRAYQHAITSGDMDLAVRAAHMLDRQPPRPFDAIMLLALEAIRSKDWGRARTFTEELAQDQALGGLASFFRAWIAVGAGVGDPLAVLNAGSAAPLAAPYSAEQRLFLLVALGRRAEALAGLDARTAARLPLAIGRPGEGLALLLMHVASDARQQYPPVALAAARLATYAAPEYAAGWLVLADILRALHKPDLALAATAHVGPGDPLAGTARSLGIALLNDAGKHDAALARALAEANQPHAGAVDWGRVGDLYLAVARPAEAAGAYGKAVAMADAAHAPADVIWPLLLEQGGALDLAGDWVQAKAALGRAYALAPGEAVVLNQFGYSMVAHREDVDRAAAMIEQASRLRPDDPAITDSLGWVHYLRGRPAEAVPLLERAAAGEPGEAAINEHLGDAYWALGRLYDARYAWRAALITAEDKDRARLAAKIDVGLSKATGAP